MPSFRLLLSLTRCRAHENVNDRLESGADGTAYESRCVVAASNERNLAAAVGRQDGRTDGQTDGQTDGRRQNKITSARNLDSSSVRKKTKIRRTKTHFGVVDNSNYITPDARHIKAYAAHNPPPPLCPHASNPKTAARRDST